MSNKKLKQNYRNIFIVDSALFWDENNQNYSKNRDLILTYDLGLLKHTELLGGDIFYIDHLVDCDTMQQNNFIIYKFFNDWHKDYNGNDILTYKNISFGFSFRLDFWNDYVSYVRLYLSLSKIKEIHFDRIFVISETNTISNILYDLDINFQRIPKNIKNTTYFYFPIEKWLNEKIRPVGFRGFLYKIRALVTALYGYTMPILDKLVGVSNKKVIFIQEYHPTKEIIKHLRANKNIRILLANFSRGSKLKDNLNERLLPISGSLKKYKYEQALLIEKLKNNRYHKLILSNGDDVSSKIYEIIESRVKDSIAKKLRIIDASIKYIDKYGVDMEILIANLGETVTVFDCVCKSKGIPSYLIINGMLTFDYFDEAKYATVINSYSQSIKENYFRGMDNIVTLGDPRMDMYSPSIKLNSINTNLSTVTIGASGFGNTSLHSYVAIEFDFMHDILSSFQKIKENGTKVNINIKVRPNGYAGQYKKFVQQFFPNLEISIQDTIAMKDILESTDLYISIYSQTLFEASCMGIPVIYYKKDTEVINPPFDCNSELVTIQKPDELIQAFYDFQNKDSRYDSFLDRRIMEKYIGPLDGKNLERNIDYIYKLLEKKNDT